MKFGFDIHGVIDALPKVFSFLTQAIVAAGGEVHILTGGTWTTETEKQLKDLGIVWTHHFSVYDHLIDTKVNIVGEIKFPDGTIQQKFEDGHWDQVKGEYCSKHNINLHIDDTLLYNDYFTTPFTRIWTHNNKPKASHKDVRHLA
jgi:hypothetical protein